MKRAQRVARIALWMSALGLAATVIACGGGYKNPNNPSPPAGGGGGTGGGGSTGVSNIVVTITSTGASVSATTLTAGGTITWINNDNRAHDMESDPHPQHTDCPTLGSGDLNPGTQRTSAAVTSVRTCGFHDHLNPGTQALEGRITVQ
jgi:plastocyanin